MYDHRIVETDTPAPFTLSTMGRVATEAADTPAFREWAALLATRARPRDYRGMLEQLYHAILQRWRYVPESEEWIHGSADSLIAHVLGSKYTAPNDSPSRTRIDALRGQPGWGDCDDVSTVVAAGVRALGMRPMFRVVRAPGGAHVSVVARTPAGELVSIDPVGHPSHPFGWALPGEDVQLFELDGSSSSGLSGVDAMSNQCTVVCRPNGHPYAQIKQPHWIATDPNDSAGPRSLALPEREFRLFARGLTVDGCPAFDESGNPYTYDAARDLWLSRRLAQTRLADRDEPMGGIGRRARRRARRRGRRAKRRRVFRRVAKRVRGVAAKVLQNRVVQGLVSRGVQAVTGTPAIATKAAMRAGGRLFERGGVVGLAKRLRRNPRGAARAVAAAGRFGTLRAGVGFSGDCGCSGGTPDRFLCSQNGSQPFVAAPVLSLSGVPGLVSFGQLEVTTTPQPGRWYRIQRGDNLLSVAERALGQPRLTHSKWINAAQANAVFLRPAKPGFEANQYGSGVITFNPRYASDSEAASRGESGSSYAVIWIPAAPGDEPPDPEPDVEVEPDDEADEIPPDPEPPVEPDTPDLPPADPEPEDDVPDVPSEADLAAQCAADGGVWVPGRGCIQCPPGSTWSSEWDECIADKIVPDVVQPPADADDIPDVPDVEPPVEPTVPDMVVPDPPVAPEIPPLDVEPMIPPDTTTPWNPGADPGGANNKLLLALGAALLLSL